MTVESLGVDRAAENFLTGDGFKSLCMAMAIINASSDSETVNALSLVAINTFVLNWAKGSSEGYGMSIARLEDTKQIDGSNISRGRGFPQLDLQKNKSVEQITIHTGLQTLSAFHFPPDAVVEDSNRFIAASLEKVKKTAFGVKPEMVDAILLQVQHGGGIRLFERPYKGHWNLKPTLSNTLRENVNHRALSNDLARIS